MPKRKNLTGIPHNVTKSFFGAERYYYCGYMGDWLLNAAKTLQLTTASLDVLSVTFSPSDLNIPPLLINAASLKNIVEKELKANDFDSDYFTQAIIEFEFPNTNIYKTTFYCFTYLIDKDGNRYESRRILEEGLEPEFNPFKCWKNRRGQYQFNL